MKWFVPVALFAVLLAYRALMRTDASRAATDRELDALECEIEPVEGNS